MKSRYDVLQSATDRRHLALFRSSSAVGVVMAILVVSAAIALQPAPEQVPSVNLFAAEIGTGGTESFAEPAAEATNVSSPRFERLNEPAIDVDVMNAHGG